MLTVTFARHGRYDGGDLNDEGIKEAQSLGKVLDGQNFNQLAINSSPVTRAKQTSGIVSEVLGGIEVVEVDRLKVDSSNVFHQLTPENIALIKEKYLAHFIELPKTANDILFVSHEPNIVGFGIAFSKAVGNLYCKPYTGGAVTYAFDVETWSEAIEAIQAETEVRIAMMHQARILQLG